LLQDKDAQAASLSALHKAVAQLQQTIHELEPELVPAQPSELQRGLGDPYASLKALENACERLSLQRRQMEQQLADAQGRMAAAELEAVQQSERITMLTFAEEQAKEMSTELATLKEHQAEIVAQLEAVRKEKATLQVPQTRGACRAGSWRARLESPTDERY